MISYFNFPLTKRNLKLTKVKCNLQDYTAIDGVGERSGLPNKPSSPYNLEFCGGISNFHISVTDICSKLIKKKKQRKTKKDTQESQCFLCTRVTGRLVKQFI